MATTKADMQRLIAQRDQLLREVEALRNKVSGIEMAIALLESDTAATMSGKSRQSVKAVILDLLGHVGTTGLSATSAVEMASRRGITLHGGSVSSTLSRFKKDNVVVYDGERYRLAHFAKEGGGATVIHTLWPPRSASASD